MHLAHESRLPVRPKDARVAAVPAQAGLSLGLRRKEKEVDEEVSKTPKICETCDNCVYVGEGDFICIRKDEPELVIIDWQAVRDACRKWKA